MLVGVDVVVLDGNPVLARLGMLLHKSAGRCLRQRLQCRRSDGNKNIVEGPQSASLFEIPAGYRKFDPQALIEIIKQSDVWVDEPPR